MTSIVLIAKEALPGKVKTRLHPPLSLEAAAELAAAAIADTLAAIADVPATRRVLLFDGAEVPPDAEGYDVMDQVAGELDLRLGAMFDECDGPTVLIGMDTPQVTAEMIAPMFEPWPPGVDAWFGAANDGGFWALALANPDGDLVRGVPMSRDDTGSIQLQRLRDAGLTVCELPELTDVDTIDDAIAVARAAPLTRFAMVLASHILLDWQPAVGRTAPAPDSTATAPTSTSVAHRTTTEHS